MRCIKTQLCVKLKTLWLVLMLEENIRLWDTETEIILSEPQRESSSDVNEKRAASHGFCSPHRCVIGVPKEKGKRRVCEAKIAPYVF